MTRFVLFSSFALLAITVLVYNNQALLAAFCISLGSISIFRDRDNHTTTTGAQSSQEPTGSFTTSPAEESMNAIKNIMSKTLSHAKITPHRSSARGHADHGWLNTYHSFSFASWYNPDFTHFGSLRVLNEDRVKANSGFPTHPHRDFEIFSYVLSGELTHRDSMLQKGSEGGQSDRFYRMRRGDVQFTTGGTGIAHSEFNEHTRDTVHFLQIWAIPWKKGLAPRYHTRNFPEEDKRAQFVPILSPLKGGPDATAEEEKKAEPEIPNTIPIHADFVMAAGIIAPESKFVWSVGANVTEENKRKVYIHLPMTKGGKSKIRIDGRDDVLNEGDGVFVDSVRAGDKLSVESVGEVEAEVVLLDTA